MPGKLAHTFNDCTREAEADGLLCESSGPLGSIAPPKIRNKIQEKNRCKLTIYFIQPLISKCYHFND